MHPTFRRLYGHVSSSFMERGSRDALLATAPSLHVATHLPLRNLGSRPAALGHTTSSSNAASSRGSVIIASWPVGNWRSRQPEAPGGRDLRPRARGAHGTLAAVA